MKIHKNNGEISNLNIQVRSITVSHLAQKRDKNESNVS